MKRNLLALTDTAFDLLIVGGGIYGAALTWEAVSRGLSVALVEKGDFGGATSANSLKIIHGGLRYLQHADFKRMRESIRERRNLLKIAPHLIHPLPIVVPTYGHGVKGREAMGIALKLNDLISCDRNWSIPDPAHHIPAGRILSKAECLAKLPGIRTEGLTGGAAFCDAQVYNSERLTLAFLKSAAAAGAQMANYAPVVGLLQQGERIQGAVVQDALTGEQVEVRAKWVINTTGPWIHQLIRLAEGSGRSPTSTLPPNLAKAVNFVVRPLFEGYAVGLQSQNASHDEDAVINKGSRFLFTAPWRQASMIGTWYFPYDGTDPTGLAVTPEEIEFCLRDMNGAYPPARLTVEDIQYVHCGLLPSRGLSRHGEVNLAKHYAIDTHTQAGITGLLTVSGVKYTTARDVASKVVTQVLPLLGKPATQSRTDSMPLVGGDLPSVKDLVKRLHRNYGQFLSEERLQDLVFNYGTEAEGVLSQAFEGDAPPPQSAQAAERQLLQSQVRYAVRAEMAQHLLDVILRRTGLGSAKQPSAEELAQCAEVMAEELGWSIQERARELEEVTSFYRCQLSKPTLAMNA